jgi:hypothetical protein
MNRFLTDMIFEMHIRGRLYCFTTIRIDVAFKVLCYFYTCRCNFPIMLPPYVPDGKEAQKCIPVPSSILNGIHVLDCVIPMATQSTLTLHMPIRNLPLSTLHDSRSVPFLCFVSCFCEGTHNRHSGVEHAINLSLYE